MDLGHQNWHKSGQNGTELYCKGIKLINIRTGIKLQSVEIRRRQQKYRKIHIRRWIWIYKNLMVFLVSTYFVMCHKQIIYYIIMLKTVWGTLWTFMFNVILCEFWKK